jgi:hypothetical protein
MNKKLTIEEMQVIARNKNGYCLSNKYINSQTKLEWRCNEDHTWNTTPSAIKTGQWCPKCAKNKKRNKKE